MGNHRLKEDEERLRRFNDFLDEDDDSDFELVSSTKQRLDLLNKAMEDDDDIIVVSIKPKKLSGDQDKVQKFVFVSATILLGFLTLTTIYHWFKKKQNHEPLYESTNKEKKEGRSSSAKNATKNKSMSETNPLEAVRTGTGQNAKGGATTTDDSAFLIEEQIEKKHANRIKESVLEELPPTSNQNLTSDTESIIHKESCSMIKQIVTPQLTSELATDVNFLVEPKNNIRAFSDSKIVLKNDEELRVQREKVIESAATQMAQDIKLLEDALFKNGIADYKVLAPALAVNLQASQQIMESQRELETQRILLDVHQKHLDRQLSQRQHEESIQAAKYDPNWKEKLERARDNCWDCTSRLLIEAVGAYQLFKIARPLVHFYNKHNASGSTILSKQQEVVRLVFASVSIRSFF